MALSLIRRCCSSNMSEEHTEEKRDKVRNGPCANIFADLEKCGIIKGVSGRAEKLEACPSETDRLIRCINKNPLFFGKGS